VGVGGPAHGPTNRSLGRRALSVVPARSGVFANGLRTLPRAATVVVDEIHRLPALLNEVHRFIEDRGLRFVLLESIARKLKQASTSLLAGSAAVRQMFPLLPQELGRATLEQAAFPGSRQSSCST
jgi:hypothetical protein